MGLIREPKNVDFTVIDNPWTEEERKEFSELIIKEKAKQGEKGTAKRDKLEKGYEAFKLAFFFNKPDLKKG